VRDHRLADHHGIATEAQRLGLGDGEQTRDVLFKDFAAIGIESVRIIESLAWSQGTKARIEMVKAWIDQLQRQDLSLDGPGQRLVPLHVAAEAIAREERRT